MAGPPPERKADAAAPASVCDLLRRIRARGGDLRVNGTVVQYRPDGALTLAELDWLRKHRGQIARALSAPDPDDAAAFRRWLRRTFDAEYVCVGTAGPASPVWIPTVSGRWADPGHSRRGSMTPWRPATGSSRAPCGAPR